MTNIQITIDGKPAYGMMLKHRVKNIAVDYGNKIDRFFVTGRWNAEEPDGSPEIESR